MSPAIIKRPTMNMDLFALLSSFLNSSFDILGGLSTPISRITSPARSVQGKAGSWCAPHLGQKFIHASGLRVIWPFRGFEFPMKEFRNLETIISPSSSNIPDSSFPLPPAHRTFFVLCNRLLPSQRTLYCFESPWAYKMPILCLPEQLRIVLQHLHPFVAFIVASHADPHKMPLVPFQSPPTGLRTPVGPRLRTWV